MYNISVVLRLLPIANSTYIDNNSLPKKPYFCRIFKKEGIVIN